jgi:hypothetical protein
LHNLSLTLQTWIHAFYDWGLFEAIIGGEKKMKYKLSKKWLILAVATLLILMSFPNFSSIKIVRNDIDKDNKDAMADNSNKGTHTVLAEYGTATWCGFCKYAHAALKNIWAGGQQDFYYVVFVNDVNPYCAPRMTEYNLYGYPTVWFDGGYQVVVGAGSTAAAEANYNAAIDTSEVRAVYDVDAQLSVEWQGSATMSIDVSVLNNEGSTYDGHIRVYVTEIENTQGWTDTWGYPYTYAFLNYALDQDISIGAGNTWSDSTIWNGNDYGFGSITDDNIMVIAAVFNDDWHQGYSYPPSSNPFDAYYVDETVGAIPSADTDPPIISNIQAIPSVQESGQNVEISADVTDDSGINEVKAVITYPDLSIHNETMILDGGDTYVYDSSYSMLGTYNFNIWAEDSNGNHDSSGVFSFEVISPYITTVSTNWNLISLPFNKSVDKEDLIVNYGTIDYTWADAVIAGYISDFIFGWDRNTQSYTFANTLEPGYGYWMFAYSTCDILVQGISNVIIDNYITSIHENWNIIGSPLDQSVAKADLIVEYNGYPYSWSDAVTAGYISDFIFGWDRNTQSYTFSDSLEPGYSYWIFSYEHCTLLCPDS